jgi:hypothetical protein
MSALMAFFLMLMPPCPTEDSTDCGWNAQQQGNGVGTSFVSIDDRLLIAQVSQP